MAGFKEVSMENFVPAYTSKSGEIVVSDLSCYTCDKCIVSDYEHCLHTEHTGQKRLVRPVEEHSNNADNEDNF
jgi:hypothetical protein